MRKLSITFIYILLVIAALVWGFIIMLLVQGKWLKSIQAKINSTQSVGFPTSAAQLPSFSMPTAPNPVSVGQEAVINHVGITVTGVIYPADAYVGKAVIPYLLNGGKHYLVVDVKVRCLSQSQTCRVQDFDFGVEAKSGQD